MFQISSSLMRPSHGAIKNSGAIPFFTTREDLSVTRTVIPLLVGEIGRLVAASIFYHRDRDTTLAIFAVAARAQRLELFLSRGDRLRRGCDRVLDFCRFRIPFGGRLTRDHAACETHDSEQDTTRTRRPIQARVPPTVHFASGSGRIWKWIAMLDFPLPPSLCQGLRFDQPVHSPLPFQPAFGSSIRPLIDFA